MTYDTINKFHSNRTYQYGAYTFKSIFITWKSHFSAHAKIWRIAATCLSLRSGSARERTDFACSGTENCFHGETCSESHPASERNGQDEWLLHQRFYSDGPCAVSSRWGRSWLKRQAKEQFKLNISMIDWQLKNLLLSIDYWFLITFIGSIKHQLMHLKMETP